MDSYFSYPVIEAVELMFNYTKSPVYLYELTYVATNSFSQIFGDPDGKYGKFAFTLTFETTLNDDDDGFLVGFDYCVGDRHLIYKYGKFI